MTPLCHCAKTRSIGFSRTQNSTDLAGKAVRLAKLRRLLILGWGRMKYLEKNGRAWRGSRRLSLSCTHVWGHQKEVVSTWQTEYEKNLQKSGGATTNATSFWCSLAWNAILRSSRFQIFYDHNNVEICQLSQEYLPRESEYVLSYIK